MMKAEIGESFYAKFPWPWPHNVEMLYKCPDCGEPMVVSNSPNDPWQYVDGYWKHKCEKTEK